MSKRIAKLVQGVHMGLGHDGLRKLLAKPVERGGADLDLDALAPNDLVMCLNGHGDKMKVIGHKGLVLGYLKMPNKQRIMREAIQYIPSTFGAGEFNFEAACRRAIEERLGRNRPASGPLNAARAKQAAGV